MEMRVLYMFLASNISNELIRTPWTPFSNLSMLLRVNHVWTKIPESTLSCNHFPSQSRSTLPKEIVGLDISKGV